MAFSAMILRTVKNLSANGAFHLQPGASPQGDVAPTIQR
jgi:hypothetical protein